MVSHADQAGDETDTIEDPDLDDNGLSESDFEPEDAIEDAEDDFDYPMSQV